MSLYHKYEVRGLLYFLDPGRPDSFTAEVAADKGLQGYRQDGPHQV